MHEYRSAPIDLQLRRVNEIKKARTDILHDYIHSSRARHITEDDTNSLDLR